MWEGFKNATERLGCSSAKSGLPSVWKDLPLSPSTKKEHCALTGGCMSENVMNLGSHRPDWKEEADVWGAGSGRGICDLGLLGLVKQEHRL